MSASLKSYPEYQRAAVAHRREQAGTMGLGYRGARDALRKLADLEAKRWGGREAQS